MADRAAMRKATQVAKKSRQAFYLNGAMIIDDVELVRTLKLFAGKRAAICKDGLVVFVPLFKDHAEAVLKRIVEGGQQ